MKSTILFFVFICFICFLSNYKIEAANTRTKPNNNRRVNNKKAAKQLRKQQADIESKKEAIKPNEEEKKVQNNAINSFKQEQQSVQVIEIEEKNDSNEMDAFFSCDDDLCGSDEKLVFKTKQYTQEELEQYKLKRPEGIPLPAKMHQKIIVEKDKRIIIIGDVHGMLRELKELLNKLQYNQEKDVLFFVGDLLHHGPDSVGVLRFVKEHGKSVRGNYEDNALFAIAERERIRKTKGENNKIYRSWKKYDYVDEFTAEEIEWLSQLPLTITINQGADEYRVVHAGFNPGLLLNEQDPAVMTQVRSVYYSKDQRQWVALDFHGYGTNWAATWPGFPHVYFGHDAPSGLQLLDDATGLDTGCYTMENTSKLTAAIVPNTIVSVDCYDHSMNS